MYVCSHFHILIYIDYCYHSFLQRRLLVAKLQQSVREQQYRHNSDGSHSSDAWSLSNAIFISTAFFAKLAAGSEVGEMIAGSEAGEDSAAGVGSTDAVIQ